MNELDRVFRRAPDVRYRVVAGEAVVIRQVANEVLGLNEVGSRILDLCDGRRTLGAVLDQLAREFDGDHGVLASDAVAFVRELTEAGLLEPSSDVSE